MGYEPKVYREQGGNTLVILGRNGGVVKGQTSAAATPAAAAAIADVGVTTAVWTTADKGKVNSIMAALRGVGILATS
jgi:hypothetical protein